MRRLRHCDPASKITLACRPGLGDFFTAHGLVDEVVEIEKRSQEGRRQALAHLRGQVWDWVLVPHESVRTALWMSRLRARRGKIGFFHWWNKGLFDHRVKRPAELPDALRQLSLLSPIDRELEGFFGSPEAAALASPRAQLSPWKFSSPAIPSWASMQVLEHRPEGRRIFLAPGSVWATKRWTAEGYVELARLLVERGFQVELVGSPAERELCESIACQVHGVISLAGKTSLAELVGVLNRGVALVCNDSGSMHAAAAAGLPIVAIFGPTTLDLGFRPWSEKAVVVQRELKCRPCGKHGANTCPIGTHECMKEIRAPEVWLALQNLLGESAHL